MNYLPKIDILRKTHYFLPFFFLFLIASCTPVSNVDVAQNNDLFDLSEKKFDDFRVYSLKGDWDFYWDTLLTPEQIQNTTIEPLKIQVPSKWTELELKGENLPSKGYATYHTKIVVHPNSFYSFKFKRIFLACNVFINDSLALSIGKVSTSESEFTSNRLTKEYAFYSEKDTIDLTIQVANFSHKKAGIMRAIKFGSPRAIVQFAYTNLLYDVFILGALAFMMIFYLFIFYYQKQNKSNLFFAIFLLTEIIAISLDRELVFMRVFSDVSWEFASKLFYISMFARTLMFVILIESLTKKYFSKIIKKVSLIFTVVVAAFIVATPMRVYSDTLIIMILFSISTLLYEMWVTLKVSLKDRDILLSFFGLFFILLSAINDTLFEFGLIQTFYSTGLGVFLFTLNQAIVISIKNAKLQKQDEIFSKREKLENELRNGLLTSHSYDLPESLKSIIDVVGLEKIVLFTVRDDKYEAYLKVEQNLPAKYLNKKVIWSESSEFFNVGFLKQAIDNKKNIVLSNKEFSIPEKNLIILPILKDQRIISVLYMENKKDYLTKIHIEILLGLKSQFSSLINTALSYYLLQEMNNVLENSVQERTVEVENQKQDLDFKNQQLDEKVQLLEEQYAIQNEINSELQTQIEELDVQSKNLVEQTNKINTQKEEIKKQNKQINSNIKYAKTILRILNIREDINKTPFTDFFHLDIAKDILSGDFFFSKKINNYFVFGLGDCTGHGVPGALMSIFSNRNLERIILEQNTEKNELDPAIILNLLRDAVKKGLVSENKELKDGLDLGLCVFNTKNNELSFAGAYNTLYLVRKNELVSIKGNRMPIGSYVEGFEFSFSKKIVDVKKGDVFYLNSDGFVDQFSSENNEKYYTSNFKKLILKISNMPLSDQKQYLYDEFQKWKGSHYQMDDVSVIGVKF